MASTFLGLEWKGHMVISGDGEFLTARPTNMKGAGKWFYQLGAPECAISIDTLNPFAQSGRRDVTMQATSNLMV